MAALSSAIVVGGAVMPALVNRSLRYQKPTMPSAVRQAVLLAVDLPALAAGRRSGLIRLSPRAVMSMHLAGLDLGGQLAAAPLLEDVRRVVRLQGQRRSWS